MIRRVVTSARRRLEAWLHMVLPHDADHAAHHEPPFNQRFFNASSLEPRLKFLAGMVLAQVLVLLAMLALHDLPALGPPITVSGPDEFPMSMPQWNFYASIAGATFALAMIGVGLAAARGGGQFFFVAVVGLLYVGHVFITLAAVPANLVYATLALGTLALASLLGLRRAKSSRWPRTLTWTWRCSFAIAITLLVLLFLLLANVPNAFGVYMYALQPPLILFFEMAAIEWAEMADDGLRYASRPLEHATPVRWLLLAITACALLVSVILHDAWAATKLFQGYLFAGPSETLTVASCASRWSAGASVSDVASCMFTMSDGAAMLAIVLIGAVVVRVMGFARFRGNWPDHLPWVGLAISIMVGTIFVDFAVGRREPTTFAHALAVMSLFAIVTTGLLLVCGRQPRLHGLAPVALFLMLLCCLGFVSTFIDLSPAQSPAKGFMLAVAFTSAVAAGVIYRRRARYANVPDAMRLIVALNGSLLVLYGLARWLYPLMRHSAEQQAIIAAVIVFSVLLWDVVNSGHAMTNVDGVLFPRRSRVLLYFGYVGLVASLVLFWGSVGGSKEAVEHGTYNADVDKYVQVGLLEFGPVFVLTVFALRFGRWYWSRFDAGGQAR